MRLATSSSCSRRSRSRLSWSSASRIGLALFALHFSNVVALAFSELRREGILGSSGCRRVRPKMCRLAVAPFQAGAYAVAELRDGDERSALLIRHAKEGERHDDKTGALSTSDHRDCGVIGLCGGAVGGIAKG